MFEGYNQHFDGNARLTILRGLAEQSDGRLNDAMLQVVLQTYGINKGRDYLRNQLAWLDQEARAIRLIEVGSAIIAEILEAGVDHVERRRIIPGIAKPSAARG